MRINPLLRHVFLYILTGYALHNPRWLDYGTTYGTLCLP